jgi:hypothetical protein
MSITLHNKRQKSALPSAKEIAGVGSKPLGKTLSKKTYP